MGLEVVLFAISTAAGLYQQQQAKKKAAAARDASLGQDVRPSNSAEPIDVHYGYTASTGVQVYVDTHSTFDPSGVSTNLLPTTGNRASAHTKSNRKNRFLVSQHVIGCGQIDDVIDMWVDDQAPDSEFINGWAWGQWQNDGTANSIATQLSDGQRGSSDKFTGLSYATTVFELDRDNPQFSGSPVPLFFLKGNRVNTYASTTSPAVQAFTPNAAWVLLDYLTSENYGLGWSLTEDIDLESFITAAEICGQFVQGPGVANGTAGGGYANPGSSYPFSYLAGSSVVAGGTTTYQDAYESFGFFTPGGGGPGTYMSGYQSSPSNNSSNINRNIMRYEFNGSISTGAPHRDNISTILGVIPGYEFFRSPTGKWKLVVPNSTTPAADQSVGTVDTSELITNVTISYPDSNNKYNQLDIRFPNVSKDFADDTQTYPPASDLEDSLYQQLLAADNNQVLKDLIDVRGVTNEYAANVWAANTIRQSRRENYTFRTRPSGFLYEPGDVVRLLDTSEGIDVYVRILDTRVTAALEVEFTALAFEPTDYGWETAPLITKVNRGDFSLTVGTPINLAVSSTGRIAAITWEESDDEDVTVNSYVLEVDRVLDYTETQPNTDLMDLVFPGNWTTLATVHSDTLQYNHDVGLDEAAYRYRIRAITTDNRAGAFSADDVRIAFQELDVASAIEVDVLSNVGNTFRNNMGMATLSTQVSIGGIVQDQAALNGYDYSWSTGSGIVCVDGNRNVIDDGSGAPLLATGSTGSLTCTLGTPADSTEPADIHGSTLQSIVVSAEEVTLVQQFRVDVSNIPEDIP